MKTLIIVYFRNPFDEPNNKFQSPQVNANCNWIDANSNGEFGIELPFDQEYIIYRRKKTIKLII